MATTASSSTRVKPEFAVYFCDISFLSEKWGHEMLLKG